MNLRGQKRERIKTWIVYLLQEDKGTTRSREGSKEGQRDYMISSGTEGLAPSCSEEENWKLGTDTKDERLLEIAGALPLSH